MIRSTALRARAENLAQNLPALLADAEHLAATVMLGDHGRRRAGLGDEFWQYRSATTGDAARLIDWRRSARSDANFVQQKEWQAAQSVMLWVDSSQSMDFASDKGLPSKADRARLLAMATAILLIRGGERVSLATLGQPPRQGELQLAQIANGLVAKGDGADYGSPSLGALQANSRAIFVSDFLGDMAAVSHELSSAADRGIKGAMVQILDPLEETFNFAGRTIFESMGRSVRHETLKASELRVRYQERLAARKGELAELAKSTGWHYSCYHTSDPAQAALLWIYGSVEKAH